MRSFAPASLVLLAIGMMLPAWQILAIPDPSSDGHPLVGYRYMIIGSVLLFVALLWQFIRYWRALSRETANG